MLEGGYDLDALTDCSPAVMRQLAGVSNGGSTRPAGDVERPTSAGPGSQAVDAVQRHWQQQGWL
jgi:acetoin utilization deacetylase AcuC-like enzyme